MAEQVSLFPKADQVIGTLENYAKDITDQIKKAKDAIEKKEAEIEILEQEYENVRKSIRIVREEMTADVSIDFPKGEAEA